MRKISADYIFPVSSPPIKNGVVTVDDNGQVLEVASQAAQDTDIEKLNGVIVPGFVNAHCHLELSYLRGELAERKGLAGFISELGKKRGVFSSEQIKSAIERAEDEMLRNGIAAVGDVSNTDHSFEQKQKENIAYHTFMEIYDLVPERAEEKITEAKGLISKLKSPGASITPHAPYSVTSTLMELLDKMKQPFISIHNQETAAENELFLSGSGELADLVRSAGVDVNAKRRNKSSLLFTLGSILETKKILMVHNTYTSGEDVALMKEYIQAGGVEITLCLCPKANLFIENRLPDIRLFMNEGMKLTIGTDSLASNDSLSVLEEMKTISKHFPEISFETLLGWATKNGAEFLGMEEEIGTIEKGKTPVLNLLKGMDDKFQLSEKVSVQKLC